MGRICVPYKLDTTPCADSDGYGAVLTSHICSIQYAILCGHHTVNADQFCWISACPELRTYVGEYHPRTKQTGFRSPYDLSY
jgi:hypothetical protein